MRPTCLGLTALAVLAAACLASPEVSKTRAEPTGRLVFERGSDLHVINADGTGLHRLIRRAWGPAVSPDGQRIAFTAKDGLWVMNADGSGRRRLTDGSESAWSADSTTIFFTGQLGKYGSAIYRIRRDGTSRSRLPGRWSCAGEPAPSPDGRLLVYMDYSDYRGDCGGSSMGSLEARDTRGRSVSILGKVGGNWDLTSSPAWAPGGRLLAWRAAICCDEDAANGIYVARPFGTGYRRLTSMAAAPAWSPDGKWVAFVAGGALRVIARDGTGLRRITAARAGRPSWLPAVSD